MLRKSKEVAVYRGDDFVCVGTIEECAAHQNVKPDTIRYYLSGAYARKLAGRTSTEPRIEVFVLEDD